MIHQDSNDNKNMKDRNIDRRTFLRSIGALGAGSLVAVTHGYLIRPWCCHKNRPLSHRGNRRRVKGLFPPKHLEQISLRNSHRHM